MRTIEEKIMYLIKNKPSALVELMEHWHDKMPEQADFALSLAIHGKHILDDETYDKIMSALAIQPHFDSTVLKSPEVSHINFMKEDFSEHDFLYALNKMYLLFHEVVDTLEDYVYMAESYLKDTTYPDDPSERCYCEAMKILKNHNLI